MTNKLTEARRKKLAEHQEDIESLDLTGCQLLWSLKNGEGKIAAYTVLVLVPEREDKTTRALCDKHGRKIQFQVEREIDQQTGKSSEYYNYLRELELDFEKLSDKVVKQRMEEIYATFVRDRDAPLPLAPLRLCPNIVKDEEVVSHE